MIELLVVIAIIAILAAVIFPVFAQAKTAAKGTASISNAKQIGTSMILYSADYDDYAVLVGRVDPSAPIVLSGNGTYYWPALLQPYIKNVAMFQDPLRSPEGSFQGAPISDSQLATTQFGYAFTIHSPWTAGFTGNFASPISSTAVANPADTILVTSKKVRGAGADWLMVNTGVWAANAINPPYCGTIVCIPNQRWGNSVPMYSGHSFEEGVETGGVAFPKTQRSCVVWSDSHANWRRAEQLAVGTTWRRGVSGVVTITDQSQYLWDTE